MQHVASIIHLTDLHLFVDAAGNTQRAEARRATRPLVKRMVNAFPWVSLHAALGPAWAELEEKLPGIVQAELAAGAACVVTQTGDVEAFGKVGGDWLGYRALHALWDKLDPRATCIDVYGNHDIWPGTFPLESDEPLVFDQIPDIEVFEGSWTEPQLSLIEVPTSTGLRLRFHRINTVIANPTLGGLVAQGGVGPHPIPGDWQIDHTDQVVRYLIDLPGPEPGELHLGIAVTHHPPHPFDAGPGKAATLAEVHGKADFCAGATGRSAPIQLVIAGHRHAFDPGHDHPYKPTSPERRDPQRRDVLDGRQAPLEDGAGQLVSESPTIDDYPKALAIYRIFHEPGSTEVTLRRAHRSWDLDTGLAGEVDDGEVLTGLAAR